MTFGFLITSQTREELHAAFPILRAAVALILPKYLDRGKDPCFQDTIHSMNALELCPRLSYQQGNGNKRVTYQDQEIGDVLMVPFPCWTFEQPDFEKEKMKIVSDYYYKLHYNNGSLENTFIDKIIEGMAKAYLLKDTNVFGLGGYTSVVMMPKALRGLNYFVDSKISKKLEQFVSELYKSESDFLKSHLTEKEIQEGILDRISELSDKDFNVKTYNTSGSYLTAWYSFKGIEEICKKNNLDLENTPIAMYGLGSVSRAVTELILQNYESADIHIIRRNSAKLSRDISELTEIYPKARIQGSLQDFVPNDKKIVVVATSMLQPFLKAEHLDDKTIVLDDGRPKSMNAEEIRLLEEKGGQYFTLGLVKSKIHENKPIVEHGLGRRIMQVAQLKENQHLACFAETLILDKMLRDGIDPEIISRYSSLRVNLDYIKYIVEIADDIFEVDI